MKSSWHRHVDVKDRHSIDDYHRHRWCHVDIMIDIMIIIIIMMIHDYHELWWCRSWDHHEWSWHRHSFDDLSSLWWYRHHHVIIMMICHHYDELSWYFMRSSWLSWYHHDVSMTLRAVRPSDMGHVNVMIIIMNYHDISWIFMNISWFFMNFMKLTCRCQRSIVVRVFDIDMAHDHLNWSN